jgi:AraC family transposon Tn10 TetD transcriptional regulator
VCTRQSTSREGESISMSAQYKNQVAPVSVSSRFPGVSAVLVKPHKQRLEPTVSPPPIQIPGSSDWRVRKILLFIDSHDGKIGPDMADICQELDLGISADYAVKLFKKQTGVGFREYGAHKRLLKAASQLAETSLSIKVIAADLGYNSPQDFSRRFKFQYRVKPSEYRRRQHI